MSDTRTSVNYVGSVTEALPSRLALLRQHARGHTTAISPKTDPLLAAVIQYDRTGQGAIDSEEFRQLVKRLHAIRARRA